ncbi:MAG: hypothetical protein U9Q90_00655 [Campylobacterota bacterium]|nr:hypothetical protein [Campylobacterota bacterium]
MSAQKSSSILRWIIRIIVALVLLEVAYLVLFNAALNIAYTQTLVNKIKPDKFKIYWESAWTPYPLRVHANDLSVNGESRSQQWQVDVRSASASISLLSLIKHKVKVYNIEGYDADYFQRSKIKTDKDISRIAKYFPAIKGRDTNKTVSMKKKTKKHSKAWHIELDGIIAHGHHTLWINQIKADLNGDVDGDLSIETKGGPFSISNAKVDIVLNALTINADQAVLQQAKIKGDFEIAPIVFLQNKGIKSLAFIKIDSDINAQMGNLNFLDIYLQQFKGMKLDGKGALDGHIRFDKGELLPGTKTGIAARKLSVSILEHRVEGDGRINFTVTDDHPDELDAQIIFDNLSAYHEESEPNQTKENTPLFTGKGLAIKAKGSPSLLPLDPNASTLSHLGVEIPSVSVSDIGEFQRYIPNKWNFNLHKGEGRLQAKADLFKDSLSANMQLLSTGAQIGIEKNHFQSDLDLVFKLDIPSIQALHVDVSGSYISLSNSRLSNQQLSKNKRSKPWNTKLKIDKGTLTLHLPDSAQEYNTTKKLSREITEYKIKELLEDADAQLKITGTVSQLEWINFLLNNSLNLSVSGSGELETDLLLKRGWLAKKSVIKVKPIDLKVGILDYRFAGNGALIFDVTKGGQHPDLRFKLDLSNATLKRKNETQAMIGDVVLNLQGAVKNLSFKGPEKALELKLKISSAKVKQISVYNQYLPKNSPLKLIKGSADLKADILLKTHDARGYVTLKTNNLTMKIDKQKIAARLALNVKLSGGNPKNMDFDISGSSIVLDHARVVGSTTSYNQRDWSATAKLKKAHAIWKKPIKLHSKSTIKIKDSRPLVAMIDNQRGKHGWISKLLTIQNIQGIADLNIVNNVITIPYAFVRSDKIDLGAKGIISPYLRDSIFYFRYKKLKGLLKTRNGKKNFDILKVKKKFNNYVIPRH